MNSTAYENSIVLKIDEGNRAIIYDGKGPLILGVKGDDCAERVYFETPQILSPEIDLMDSSENTKITVYINYKNANREPYIQECKDVALVANTDTVTFSWLVTNRVTLEKGEVKFNVCVKKSVYNEDKDTWELTNEWHTTTFTGKVLDGIDVTAKTPEVITHDTVTLQALTLQVQRYANDLEALNDNLSDANKFIDTKVNETVNNVSGVISLGDYTDFFFEESNDYLAKVTTPGIYTFNVKYGTDSSAKDTPYILIVDNMYGSLYQAVYTNLSTDMFYKIRNSKDGGTSWSTPEEIKFANDNRVGVRYLGQYEDFYFEEHNDYLASVTTPGVYTFRMATSSKDSYYMLIVEDLYGTLYQAVYTNLSTDFHIKKRKSTNKGSSWESLDDLVFVNSSYLPKTESIKSGGSPIYLTASTTANKTEKCNIALTKAPTNGSKLRVHFIGGNPKYPGIANNQNTAADRTFVIEFSVVNNGTSAETGLQLGGQGSHFVCGTGFTGYVNVRFDIADTTGKLLKVSIYTINCDSTSASQYHMNEFVVGNVEMISGEYAALI